MAGRQYNAFMVDIETLLIWNEPGQRDMQMSVSMATSDRLIISLSAYFFYGDIHENI